MAYLGEDEELPLPESGLLIQHSRGTGKACRLPAMADLHPQLHLTLVDANSLVPGALHVLP